MTIHTMCKEEAPGAYAQEYSGWNNDKPMWVHDEYVGVTLAKWEANHYDDSDFYAAVWDEATDSIKTVEYASTRGWSYPNYATIDATPEVIEKAAAKLNASNARLRAEAATAEARVPKEGRKVRVRKGRKVPIGTTGTLTWVGPDKFQSNRWGTTYRVGFTPDDDPSNMMVFTAMSNVEVVDPQTFTADDFPQHGVPSFHRYSEAAVYTVLGTVANESLAAVGYAR